MNRWWSRLRIIAVTRTGHFGKGMISLMALRMETASPRPRSTDFDGAEEGYAFGRGAGQRASVQLSEKASAQVLNGRPSRCRGQGLPAASTPFRVSRAPSAGTSTVQSP